MRCKRFHKLVNCLKLTSSRITWIEKKGALKEIGNVGNLVEQLNGSLTETEHRQGDTEGVGVHEEGIEFRTEGINLWSQIEGTASRIASDGEIARVCWTV